MLANDVEYDLYLQNVKKTTDPVQTSIDLYHQISKFIRNIGGTQRYGEISYVIVYNKQHATKSNYIAFVSFENTVVHDEVAKVLQNFHFNDEKIFIKVNDRPTSNEERIDNKRKFKLEMYKRSKKQTNAEKKKMQRADQR